MLVIKYNFRNKSKVKKESRRITKQMRIKNKKMILKWKEISKATCIPNNNKLKEKKRKKNNV